MSAPTAVLFDAPGPKARRRTAIASVVAALALVAVLVAVWMRLDERGQLEADMWSMYLDPSDENFTQAWQRVGDGLRVTLTAAALAIVFSLVLGVFIGALRLSVNRVARVPLVAVVELLRGLPVIVTILFVEVLMRATGTYQGPVTTLVIALTLYNMVIISEITRAGVLSLPKGQVEAGLAIGMTRAQVMTQIQLPQAIRAMLPSLISQIIVILKDTALASIVLTQIEDLGKIADQLRGFFRNSLQTYFVIGLIYIVINLVLEQLAKFVQRRMSTGRTARPKASAQIEPAAAKS